MATRINTSLGAPMIYYGDEAGMWSPWERMDLDIEGEKLLHELEPATSAEPAREPTPAGH